MSNEAAVNLYGEETSVRTLSTTVAELLEAQGIEVKDNDLVIPGLEEQVTDGLEIQIIERFPVTVTIDGEEQELLTTTGTVGDRKSTRLNSSHVAISYAVFCLKKKKTTRRAL